MSGRQSSANNDLPTMKQIRDRLRTITLTGLTTSTQNVFAGDVDKGKMRYVVALFLIGDGTASRTQTIAYGGSAANARSATILPAVPVGPTGIVPFPQNAYSITDPIIVLEGGENLKASQSAGSGGAVVAIYWDSESWSTNQI